VIVITDEMIASALDRAIGQALTPEAIDARIQREIHARTATISLEDAARSLGWEPIPFIRLLRRKGVQVVHLSPRKKTIRVADLERLITDHLAPLGRRKRKSHTTASGTVPFRQAA
jgi:hypothetical protein